MSAGTTLDTGARTGAQYLDGLKADGREIWLGGERIDDVVSHPKLGAAARSMAALFDFQHAHPDEMLMPSPTTGKPVNVTHIEPKSQADLERRRIAIKLWSELHGGIMGRSPDYLNVTFALFAARADVWARRGNERGRREHRELPPAHARPRPLDHAHADQPADRPLAAGRRGGRGRDLAAQGRRVGRGDHRARRAHARDARALRGRDLGLPRQPAAAAGHALRPLLRHPHEHAGAQGDPARQLREGRSRRASTTPSARASTSRTAS